MLVNNIILNQPFKLSFCSKIFYQLSFILNFPIRNEKIPKAIFQLIPPDLLAFTEQ